MTRPKYMVDTIRIKGNVYAEVEKMLGYSFKTLSGLMSVCEYTDIMSQLIATKMSDFVEAHKIISMLLEMPKIYRRFDAINNRIEYFGFPETKFHGEDSTD